MAPPTFIILASLFIISIIASFIIQSKKKRSQNLPPGSFGWPIIGESLEFLRRNREGRPDKFVTDKLKKYNSDVFKTHLMGEPVVVLRGPTGNKFLFSNENKLVTSWWPASIQKLLGVCLVTSVGEDAKQMRKLMSYFMGPDALQRLYLKTMDFVTRQHIQSHWHNNAELKALPFVKMYTFELACRLFMSIEDPHLINRLSHLFNVVLKGIISLPINLPGARFRRAMQAAALIREELLEIVKQRREDLKSHPSQGRDLLSHLLLTPDEGGNFMSELHIANNILLLLFAGHDTSSVTITLLIKKLGELPHVYEEVLREQREIAGSKEAGEFLHWDDIQKMKYSWHVVSEVMRLYSPIFGTFREALEDVNYEGYVIPKGWKFYWNGPITHLDGGFFRDPTRFDPSRFEDDVPTPYTYVPFGGGPRMCLGKEFARLEILTFLHNVVTQFRWSLLIRDEKIEYDPMPIPVEGLPIRLHAHKQ